MGAYAGSHPAATVAGSRVECRAARHHVVRRRECAKHEET
jgi:hypothetical protein